MKVSRADERSLQIMRRLIFPNPVTPDPAPAPVPEKQQLFASTSQKQLAGPSSQGAAKDKDKHMHPADCPDNSIRAALIGLMTSIETNIKRCVAEFIFLLCHENSEPLSLLHLLPHLSCSLPQRTSSSIARDWATRSRCCRSKDFSRPPPRSPPLCFFLFLFLSDSPRCCEYVRRDLPPLLRSSFPSLLLYLPRLFVIARYTRTLPLPHHPLAGQRRKRNEQHRKHTNTRRVKIEKIAQVTRSPPARPSPSWPSCGSPRCTPPARTRGPGPRARPGRRPGDRWRT